MLAWFRWVYLIANFLFHFALMHVTLYVQHSRIVSNFIASLPQSFPSFNMSKLPLSTPLYAVSYAYQAQVISQLVRRLSIL